MSLLISTPLPFLPSLSSSSRFLSLTFPKRSPDFLQIRSPNPTVNHKVNVNGPVTPLRSSSTDVAASEGGNQLPPLESKVGERMEQKARMKMAKKIRLRRKRLLRKRMMRKKGRWPPSKMKKLKNV